jgi:HPt (histidine-containing phosphotransfer) domain-containing protein
MNRRAETEWNDKMIVRVDPELADLIPGFLDNRRRDVEFLHEAMKQGDFEVIRTVGHKMRGDGGGYGFQEISEIGAALEQAAKDRNSIEIHRWVKELSNYLERIEVVYD